MSLDISSIEMPLLNISVTSSNRGLIPWTVVQIVSGLTFVELFVKIIAGGHPMLIVNEYLSRCTLDKVFLGQSKDALSVVDSKLVIDDVCSVFGQFVKFAVLHVEAEAEEEPTVLKNALTLLMNAQRSASAPKQLPDTKQEKTKKDKLFNDLVAFFKTNNYTWETGGDTHGKAFVSQLQECLWYIDGHLTDRSHPIPSLYVRERLSFAEE